MNSLEELRLEYRELAAANGIRVQEECVERFDWDTLILKINYLKSKNGNL